MFSTKRRDMRRGSIYDKGIYPDDFDDEFKDSIRERDQHQCAICGYRRQPKDIQLDVHHINFRKDTKRRNCISLCRDCHKLVHKYHIWRWRDFWQERLDWLAGYREKELSLSVEDIEGIHRQIRLAIEQEKEYADQAQRDGSS